MRGYIVVNREIKLVLFKMQSEYLYLRTYTKKPGMINYSLK